jgi:hypothetical protein
MRFHRRIVRRVRGLALGLGAIALLAPAGAVAMPASNVGSSVPQGKIGDTPADFPGASRAPQYQPPTTIEVVRPERTIIHDGDEELPIAVASLAVLIALGGTGYVLVRMRPPARRVLD